jgi:uncharacterized membrane protein YgcG
MSILGATTAITMKIFFVVVLFSTMIMTMTITITVSAFSSSYTTNPSSSFTTVKRQHHHRFFRSAIVRTTATTTAATTTTTMAKTKTTTTPTTRLASSASASASASATETERINIIENDTVSTPIALMEERMLVVGEEHSVLEELDDSTRTKISKQLEKIEKQKVRLDRNNNSKSKGDGGGGGFGSGSGSGGGFGGKGYKKKGTFSNKKEENFEEEEKLTQSQSQQQQNHDVFDIKHDQSNFGAVIVDQGVARINNCLTEKTSSKLINYINDFLADALETQAKKNPVEDLSLEEIYAQQPKFADVREKLNRWDMLLPLETSSNEICNALYEILLETNNGCISSSIESILGPDAQLYELGTLISDPGSERQLLHGM